jgi:hypothetical protein
MRRSRAQIPRPQLAASMSALAIVCPFRLEVRAAELRCRRERGMQSTVDLLVNALAAWAAEQPEILGIGIVGSHARGMAQSGSDIDVVMIVNNPALYLETSGWAEHFGRTCSIVREDWGLMQSMRVHYENGMEVEFGIAAPAWAGTDPVDPGTARVVSGGIRLVYDRVGLLGSLVSSLTASGINADNR